MAEIGSLASEMGGVLLIIAVLLSMSVGAGVLAYRVKGRRFFAWFAISALTQGVALTLPVGLLILLGLVDPADWFSETRTITLESVRLLTEMMVVAGIATWLVISFLEQTRWKTCPACDSQVAWRAKTCPHCASSQTITPKNQGKMVPGAYPRLKSRTIHLPVELDRRLSQLTASMRKEGRLSDEAAVSQFVRDILIKANAASAEEQKAEQTEQA